MPYGAIKVDNITFTNGGADQATTVSGIYRAITSGVTVTGTISGVTIQGTTVSGTTVTGTTANFTSGVFTVLSGASTTFTSGIFAAGSAAAPSISFTSDPNTGIYSPGADQVAIASSGTGRLFVNSSGNVGIGTSTPGERLDIQGGGVNILNQGAGSYLEIGRGTTTSQNVYIDLIGDTTYTDYGFRMQRADSGPNALSILEHRGTGDFVVRAQEAAPILFYTTNAERFRITPAGNVGINTSSPSTRLDVNGEIRGVGSANALRASNGSGSGQTTIGLTREGASTDQKTWEVFVGGAGEFKIRTINDTYTGSQDAFAVDRGSSFSVDNVQLHTNGSERLRIDSSGRLLVGTSSARANFFNGGNTALFQVEGTGETAAIRNLNDNFGAMLLLGKSRSTSNTIVQNGDNVGLLTFQGNDGTEFVECAAILAYIDGTPGANDMPGRLVFSTTADGSASPTERLRINSTGLVGIGTSAPVQQLSVHGTANDTIDETTGICKLQDGGGNGLLFGTRASAPFQAYIQSAFVTDTSVAQYSLLLNPLGGNVGINITAPLSAFHIAATGECSLTIGNEQTNTDGIKRSAIIKKADNNLEIRATESTVASATIFTRTNSAESARIDSSGNVGIGTSSPNAPLCVNGLTPQAGIISAVAASGGRSLALSDNINCSLYVTHTAGGALVGTDLGNAIRFATNGFSSSDEKARIDSSGRLLVGTSTSRSNWANQTGTDPIFQIEKDGDARTSIVRTSANEFGPQFWFGKTRGAAYQIVSSADQLGEISFMGADGTELVSAASITASVDGTPGANDMPGRLVFSTTADGAASPTERMSIKSDGNVNLGGGATGSYRLVIRCPNTTETTGALLIENSSATGSVYFFNVSGTGVSTAAAAMWIEKNTSNNRSINAGGTINASGADYAEYMTKAGDFDLDKGDVCGVTADGFLTDIFVDAISFLVKSTNPSYVGGDTWGSENTIGPKPEADDTEALAQWENNLEAARQKVDRVAFAGQVPVNVIGATPGQYIIPVATTNGGITGIAKNKSEMTAAEYIDAVGKVIAIEDDGRARIIVKVA
jgi:hypothetical protein